MLTPSSSRPKMPSIRNEPSTPVVADRPGSGVGVPVISGTSVTFTNAPPTGAPVTESRTTPSRKAGSRAMSPRSLARPDTGLTPAEEHPEAEPGGKPSADEPALIAHVAAVDPQTDLLTQVAGDREPAVGIGECGQPGRVDPAPVGQLHRHPLEGFSGTAVANSSGHRHLAGGQDVGIRAAAFGKVIDRGLAGVGGERSLGEPNRERQVLRVSHAHPSTVGAGYGENTVVGVEHALHFTVRAVVVVRRRCRSRHRNSESAAPSSPPNTPAQPRSPAPTAPTPPINSHGRMALSALPMSVGAVTFPPSRLDRSSVRYQLDDQY